MDEEFDDNDINEILKELSEPFQHSFISEIKEKIILNAQ
jgi:hypothetical protein